MYTHTIAGLISRIPVGTLEIPAVSMGTSASVTSAIKARLVSPTACANGFAVTTVPACVHADRPLEVKIAAIIQGAGAGAAESVASWISANALLQISVEVPGQPRGVVSVLVKARPLEGGWIIRALVHPSVWANAASVTMHSMSLAGQPLPCDCLPATLRVGYNHAPAPEGAVFAAARDGDVPALQVALDAGGSTEEVDTVRGGGGRGKQLGEGRALKTAPICPPALSPLRFLHFCTGSTAELLFSGPPAKATLRPSADSLLQAPTRPQPTL